MAIVGPTASGKSELAVFLAKQIKKYLWGGFQGAEIISADSRQVYTHLNIGTNKVSGQWHHWHKIPNSIATAIELGMRVKRVDKYFSYKNIPHHCIDIVNPQKTFTVVDYKMCAKKAINDIHSRENLPIIVGGTGFYIDAVLYNLSIPPVPPNMKLRNKLHKKSPEELFIILKKIDPKRAFAIDRKNPRRLIRSIEIADALGNVPSLEKQSLYTAMLIGIKKTTVELESLIKKRSKKQIPGLLKETKQLLSMRIPKRRIRELGFEYSLALNFLHPRVRSPAPDKELLKKQIEKENWHYTKRQMTWFKRDKRIHWITTKKDALELIRAFLKNRATSRG